MISIRVKTRGEEYSQVWRYPELWEGAKPTSNAEAWALTEFYVIQQGYFMDVTIDGPRFKPENRYLTNEGYPLNTTCWYFDVYIPALGRKVLCRDTFIDAAWALHVYISSSVNMLRRSHEEIYVS